MKNKINSNLINLLKEKASHSPVSYKVSAVAFDKHGDILGHMTSSISRKVSYEEYRKQCKNGIGRSGTGEHAERRLMQRYGSLIKTILICRVGRKGDILPIDPCKKCLEVADKLGIRIISVLGS